MPDPTLPAALHRHAETLREAARHVSDDVSSTRWRSLSAGRMREQASAVVDALIGAATAVDEAAGGLATAHEAALARLEALRADLAAAVAQAAAAGRAGLDAARATAATAEGAVRGSLDDGALLLSGAVRRAEEATRGLGR